MYQQTWRKPKQSTNNFVYDVFSIGLSLYIAYINTKNFNQNLFLNSQNAENTKKILEIVDKINNKI